MIGRSKTDGPSSDDAGFGLVEIIISMFLLTLISVAFLPLLVDSLRVAVRNNTMATATQLLSQQLDLVSEIPRTCAALNNFEAASVPTSTNVRGVVFAPQRDAATCPASGYPLSVSVRVWVTISSDPSFLVESRTTVIIESDS